MTIPKREEDGYSTLTNCIHFVNYIMHIKYASLYLSTLFPSYFFLIFKVQTGETIIFKMSARKGGAVTAGQ
jgi:hypothetical protein